MTFDAWFSSTSLVLIRISRLNSSLKFGMECVYVLPTSEKFYNVSSEKHFRAAKTSFQKGGVKKTQTLHSAKFPLLANQCIAEVKVSFQMFS